MTNTVTNTTLPAPWKALTELPILDKDGRSDQVWLAMTHASMTRGYLVKGPRSIKAFDTDGLELDLKVIAWAPMVAPAHPHQIDTCETVCNRYQRRASLIKRVLQELTEAHAICENPDSGPILRNQSLATASTDLLILRAMLNTLAVDPEIQEYYSLQNAEDNAIACLDLRMRSICRLCYPGKLLFVESMYGDTFHSTDEQANARIAELSTGWSAMVKTTTVAKNGQTPYDLHILNSLGITAEQFIRL